MLKVDASLGSRVISPTHTLRLVVESVSQVNCNQGVCEGSERGGVMSVVMVAHCIIVISHARSLLNKQILVSQPDILSPVRHSFNHDYWSSYACSSHILCRKWSSSDFFTGITYELWVVLPWPLAAKSSSIERQWWLQSQRYKICVCVCVKLFLSVG